MEANKGEKIVSTLDGYEQWKNVICTVEGFHKSMCISRCGSEVIHHYEYRHATDEEIAAGHRL